ncbi:MAG TPA: phosphotransferase, partial [Terriglobia bacterium]|nr:phosphotransferase [Terriglobia bacterium]
MTLLKPFASASYLSQVRRLRDLADRALTRYPVRVRSCTLISHWENTTFRVTSTTGKTFLLRVHRHGYHTQQAILEELRWLEKLSMRGTVRVPAPVRSKAGHLLELVASPLVPHDCYCSLFHWIDGRFFEKAVGAAHLNQLGRVIGELQKSTEGVPVVHRRYWDAEGLVGRRPKFGSIDALEGISHKTQDVLSRAREVVFRRLRRFEISFPEKRGLIHADLHFGNLLMTHDGIAVIDFDDCGFGFHVYDLAVNLGAVEFMARQRKEITYARLKDALIQTYANEMSWDRQDEAILPYFMTARKLLML